METPYSSKMTTMSSHSTQSASVSSNTSKFSSWKNEESKQRSLIDITNGSPIVGLATAKLSQTPITSATSYSCKKTPGSGEALLRCQVKSLLQQQQQQQADISKFLSFDNTVSGRCYGHGHLPAAPTPANTPQVFNFNSSLQSVLTESPIQDQLTVSKVVNGMIDENSSSEWEKDVIISRSLFEDFLEKSAESSSDCSSVMTFQGSAETTEKRSQIKLLFKDDDDDDDDSSAWSLQVNTSIRDEDEDEDEAKSEVVEVEELLCEGIRNMEMNEAIGRSRGKLIKFVYDSDDDELVDEEEVLRLKGLPTPKGKHLRFQDEEDDE